MTVTFRLHGVCPVCGYRTTGILSQQVRVNKRTLVSTNPGLGWTELDCCECRHPLDPQLFDIAALDPQDQARVAAYQQRRGWTT